MFRVAAFVLACGLVVLSGGLNGQEAKKDDPKSTKKEEPKVKGQLPPNWGKIGLSDDQKKQVYKIQGKYAEEIDKLESKIKELKGTARKEMFEVLTADQKKRLEELLKAKSTGE